METWEYRVANRNGTSYSDYDADTRAGADLNAAHCDEMYPDEAPHRVERRLVGVWQPVETKDTDA